LEGTQEVVVEGFLVRWLTTVAFGLLLAAVGCGGQDLATHGSAIRLAARRAVPLTVQQKDAVPHAVPGSVPDDADDEDDKDYWEGVDFTADDFAEVRRFVKLFYIDPSYDKHMAWIMAANGALSTMIPPREMLPEDYYKKKKTSSKERADVAGNVSKLKKGDQFVIREAKKDDRERPTGQLSPKEIRNKKREYREKQEEYERFFARVSFTEADFVRVVEFIRTTEVPSNPKFRMSKVYIAAAQGYLGSLDPHSTIISTKAWDESTKSTVDGSFEGIGAVLTKKGDDTIIESPMEGQPAFKAGLRAGDVIVSVDEKAITKMDLSKVVKRIRGTKGTTVSLTIRRLGEPKDFTVAIRREHIEVKNVASHMVDRHPDVGYVKMTGFVPSTRESLKEAIAALELQTKGGRLRGLILDLRNNAGGLLQESVDIADDFLEQGVIVSVKNPSERDDVYTAAAGGYRFPLVVLVNDNSASAAEILASAIQENDRGLVVGDRTFGKASVQTLLNPLLRRDYYIKLTVARYYAPQGRTIQVAGVIPDISIPPALGEDMPVGFREEDLAHHLSRLNADYVPPNRDIVAKVLDCDKRAGMADQIVKADPNPQIKPDYQLLKAADYLECVIQTGVAFQQGAGGAL